MWANTATTCYLSLSHAFPSNSEATQGLSLLQILIKQQNDPDKQPCYIIEVQAKHKHIFQSKVLEKRNSILQCNIISATERSN